MRLLLSAFLLICVTANSAVYYVATNGNDSWTGLAPAFTSGTTGPWLTIAHGNSIVTSGDTLFIRGGMYANDAFDPAASGTFASPIICSNYPTEVPLIYNQTNLPYSVWLNNVKYVKVFGLSISNAGRPFMLQGATNCEVAYCTVKQIYQGGGGVDTLLAIDYGSKSNWVHDNTIFKSGNDTNTTLAEGGHVMAIGFQIDSSDPGNYYNLISSNSIYWGGHDCITIAGSYNMIIGNYFHNEGWQYATANTNYLWGERCIECGGQWCLNNVISGNRIGWAGTPISGDNGGAGITCESQFTIIRNNAIFNCQNYGLECYTKFYSTALSNHIYQNTFFNNGNLGPITWVNTNNPAVTNDTSSGRGMLHLVSTTNNVFVNNLGYDNSGNRFFFPKGGTNAILGDPGPDQWRTNFNFYTNALAGIYNTNPIFIDESYSDPFSTTQPDMHLQSNSPCVDAGTWLTTITSSSGSGTTFTVGDSKFFYNGFGMLNGDQIQLQGQTNPVTVTAVDYAANTVTFTPSLTWVNGQGVALAFNGTAPDIGAFETGTNTSTPSILVTPSSLDFGTTGIPFPKTLTLSVTNVGGGTLSGTASVNAPWTITAGASYSLAANAGQNVTVQFAPTATGSFSDSVVFTGGGGASIPVTGSVTNIITTVISGTTTISGTTVIK